MVGRCGRGGPPYDARMGLSFSFLACSRDGTVDLARPAGEAEAEAVVRRLFPRTPYERVGSRPLLETALPPRGTLAVGAFEDGVLIATRDAHLYDPDILHARYLKLTEWPDVRLLTALSSNDMFAYGRWASGTPQRCISVNAVAGTWRDDGSPDAFEGGAVTPDRWLDLCNGALASVLRLEGDVAPYVERAVAWEDVALHVFTRARG